MSVKETIATHLYNRAKAELEEMHAEDPDISTSPAAIKDHAMTYLDMPLREFFPHLFSELKEF